MLWAIGRNLTRLRLVLRKRPLAGIPPQNREGRGGVGWAAKSHQAPASSSSMASRGLLTGSDVIGERRQNLAHLVLGGRQDLAPPLRRQSVHQAARDSKHGVSNLGTDVGPFSLNLGAVEQLALLPLEFQLPILEFDGIDGGLDLRA